ncbi:acyl-CoA dehydrogenase family protein [Hymenobacter caeli]|uniref:Alkylation response protein AidB-like acyl-CoA dehydrogenase n=1 Tax=Hymenobacter caeli TaxID=2735894 RepID=A0ABX2FNC2_9BACT|nr:acyl-CoA dehydrogenase family protein [Hymenobacter caeli]NRT18506.1 alkylation response protein AidB-like acyl-CoA dehydrogenase [Hymenobacter caeli]
MEVSQKAVVKGGEFIIKPTDAQDVFTPADFSEEQRLMHQTCLDFVAQEVTPLLERLDNHEEGLMRGLMEKAGQQGLFGVSIPEQFGGLDMDFPTALRVTEGVGGGHSFPVAFAAHTGIAMLPILYFGNDAQKEKYLPGLTDGTLMGAYCLTEPGSGSDALGAKTKAVLNAEGTHYVLNGQKMWITNAGFADVFIVFAKIDGELFTGFIVDKDTPGLSLGNEEHKMGIKGSSTRQVFFSDAQVPKENVLGEIGKGHLIAFNVLNIGRIKLAAACLGGAKGAAIQSIKYANERVQFKLPISKFGAIRYKLAQQAIRMYAVESAIYRAGDDIYRMEQRLLAEGKGSNEALLGAAREFAVECAMLKVEGSEVLDYVVDEGVQIFGGYGFSADYPMDRAYRDSRINRIFEGTNEINRMLAVDMILKKGLKGEIDLMGPAQAVQQELLAIPSMGESDDSPFAAEKKSIANLKKAILMVAGTAVQKYTATLAKEQEVLTNIADMAIKTYVAESTLLRVEKEISTKGEEALSRELDMARVYLSDTVDIVEKAAKEAIASMSEGDEQRLLVMGLKRFIKADLFNVKDARRRVAAGLIEANDYIY